MTHYREICFDPKHEWQPIETAPKDGTEILVHLPKWNEGHRVQMASFIDSADVEYGRVTRERKYWSVSGAFLWPGKEDQEPSHWMPLPPPPEVA